MTNTKTNLTIDLSVNDRQKRLMLGELSSLCREAQAQLDSISRLQCVLFSERFDDEERTSLEDKLDKAIVRYRETIKLIQAVSAELY